MSKCRALCSVKLSRPRHATHGTSSPLLFRFAFLTLFDPDRTARHPLWNAVVSLDAHKNDAAQGGSDSTLGDRSFESLQLHLDVMDELAQQPVLSCALPLQSIVPMRQCVHLLFLSRVWLRFLGAIFCVLLVAADTIWSWIPPTTRSAAVSI